ncbi:MAG TPA: glycosyltransferase family 39 protein [Actinomycetota bacterium]|nr:glycosyltransferase family 39 protein [Actinomycetota bacterium]
MTITGRPDAQETDVNAGAGPNRRFLAGVYGLYLRRMGAFAIIVGSGVRIQQFLFRRSLWLDEAALAVSIVGRSYEDLLDPLAFGQIAPAGFLWIERFMVGLVGDNEYGLRLFPLLSGIASLVLFHRLSRRVLSPAVAPLATILFAITSTAVYYSGEVKPYSSDVLATLAVLNLGEAMLRPGPIPRRTALAFGGLGAILIWISYPVVFVMAGVGITVALYHLLAKQWTNVALLAAAGVSWGASLLGTWALAQRYIQSNPATVEYWAVGFPPDGASLRGFLSWLGTRAEEVMVAPVGLSLVGLGLILCALGAAALVARKRVLHLLLVASAFPFTIAGSIVGVYPIHRRLLMFVVPLVVLLLAASADWPLRGRLRFLTVAFIVPLIVVSTVPAERFWRLSQEPVTNEEARVIFEEVARGWRAGDALYIHPAAEAAYRYYAPRVPVRASGMIAASADRCRLDAALAPLREARRVWFVFSHPSRVREWMIIRSFMGIVGRPAGATFAHGAEVYLYEMGSPADPSGREVIRNRSIRCAEIRPV